MVRRYAVLLLDGGLRYLNADNLFSAEAIAAGIWGDRVAVTAECVEL